MSERNYERLSDYVLKALQVALSQKDLTIADILRNALEMAMTRGAGGKDFVERRDGFTAEVEEAFSQLDVLRKAHRG